MSEPAKTLEACAIAVHFDGVRAVDGLDLCLRRRETLGLIGPNGAGKTTFVNAVSGYQRPTAGKVLLSGRDITRWPPQRRATHGLARTFQNTRVFSRLSAFDNVKLGALGTGMRRREITSFVWELLDSMGLSDRAEQPARSFSYGDERRIGILRALAMRPAFALLDEPAAGLNEVETDDLIDALRRIPVEFDLGLLVIEHDMRVIMSVCQRIQVMDFGKPIAEGTPDEIRTNPVVHKAYFGREAPTAGVES